jgi:hypothetical protein|tara:strand:+ start:301 stop:594 length:294 start_codon:yes stop_codon:yes gene_type:complete
MNTTTTEDNYLDRKREVELYLAKKGVSEEDAGRPKIKGNGWFFWTMTFLTCGGWWVVFHNYRAEVNSSSLFEWVDNMLDTRDHEEHEAKLEEIKGNQ